MAKYMAKYMKKKHKSVKRKKLQTNPKIKSTVKVFSNSSFYSNINGKRKSLRIKKQYNSEKNENMIITINRNGKRSIRKVPIRKGKLKHTKHTNHLRGFV